LLNFVVILQGDPPNDLCIIVEGNVNIVKELVIVCKNRWPVGLREWKERTKKIHKPILLKQLGVYVICFIQQLLA